uniref:Uncharacterized protein n=1 Tax=viral metagenome TaxID=1070528 RepID=A0A6C0E2G2_9ZZZZ
MVLLNNNNNGMDGLEISNLLTSFNESDSRQNDIRMIENKKNVNIKLKPNKYTKYKDELDLLAVEFNDKLKELEWYYIAHLKFPDYPEYSSNYYRIKNRLDSIINESKNIGVDIQKNIDYLNEITRTINIELDRYRKENKLLENKLGNVESVDTTSQGLIDDYTDLYKNQRSYNIGMLITFVIAFFIMRKIFSGKSNNVESPSPAPESKSKD